MRDNSTEHKTRRAASSKDVRPAELDEVDRRILSLLHGDARMPNNALADTVGIAPSTCHGRVRRLVDLGVIRGFYTDIDPVAVGLPLQAMIFGQLAVVRSRENPQLHPADPPQTAGDGCLLSGRRRRFHLARRRSRHRGPAFVRGRKPQCRRRRRRYPDVPDLRASARGGAHLERHAQRAMIAGCQTLMGLL